MVFFKVCFYLFDYGNEERFNTSREKSIHQCTIDRTKITKKNIVYKFTTLKTLKIAKLYTI